LLVFTDGLVEACNGNEESFGEHTLAQLVRDNAGACARDLMALVMDRASAHCGGMFQDDASLIVLRAI
jgi:serine phosphatase RsbU (regulator of sigma subunit)